MARSLFTFVLQKLFRRKNKKVKQKEENVTDNTESVTVDDISPCDMTANCKSNGTVSKTVIKDNFEEEDIKPKMEFLELSRSVPLHADAVPTAKSCLVEGNKGEVLAKQTMIKYTPTQAYCVLSELSPSIVGKAVNVEETENTHKLKLVSIENERENRRLLPLMVQVHSVPEARPVEAHLTDRLAEDVLGRFNLELKKNVTLDSFAHSDSWRDEAGFIVTDRNRFELCTFDSAKLLDSLMPSNDTKIVPYSSEELDALCDFDNSVCGFNREAALEYLAANSTVFLAKSDSGIDGMLAAKGDQVFALYAETMEIAHALLKNYIQTSKLIQVRLFSRTDIWECVPSSRRAVYRRHTRAVPQTIKWGKVYALNMGVHIV